MKIPKLVKNEVNGIVPNSEIVLFGSRARKDFNSDSDWDFLILLDLPTLKKSTKNEILDRLYELELKTDSVISCIIHTKDEWEKDQ